VVHDDATFLARYLTSCGFFELFDPKDPRAGRDVHLTPSVEQDG